MADWLIASVLYSVRDQEIVDIRRNLERTIKVEVIL